MIEILLLPQLWLKPNINVQDAILRNLRKLGIAVDSNYPLAQNHLEELVQDASIKLPAAKKDKHEINLQEQTIIYKLNSDEILSFDDDFSELVGTDDQIRDEYQYRAAIGKIPNVRHLHDKVRKIALLMSRDQHYLANPENEFKYYGGGFWNPKDPSINETFGIEGVPITYRAENVFIAGGYYNIMMDLIGLPLENNPDPNYKAVRITGLFHIGVLRGKENGQRITYSWSLGRNIEEWSEDKIQMNREMYWTVTLMTLDSSKNDKESSLFRRDLSQAISPLLDGLKRQVVYFDNNWVPIKPR